MLPLRLIYLLFFFSLSLTTWAEELPSADAVQKSMATLNASKVSDPTTLARLHTLEETLTFLSSRDSALQQKNELRTQLNNLPTEQHQARADLNRILTQRKLPTSRFSQMPIVELTEIFNRRTQALAMWRNELSQISSRLIAAKTLPQTAMAQINTSQARARTIQQILSANKDQHGDLNDERRDLYLAEQEAAAANIALLQARLGANNTLQDLDILRRELIYAEIDDAERELNALMVALASARRTASERAIAELDASESKLTSPVLQKERALNREFAELLLNITDRRNELSRLNLMVRGKLDRIEKSSQTVEEQIAVLHGSPLLTSVLIKQKQQLPSLSADKKLTAEFADLHLKQFEVQTQRETLIEPELYVRRLISDSDSPSVEDELLSLVNSRRTLIDQLNTDLNSLLSESADYQLSQEQLALTGNELNRVIDEQLFWTPSNKPLSIDVIAAWPAKAWTNARELDITSQVQALHRGFSDNPIQAMLAALSVGLLVFRRKRLLERIKKIDLNVGRLRVDSQWNTPLALAMNFLLALPIPALLALAGYLLQQGQAEHGRFYGGALTQMAEAWLVFAFASILLYPGGIADRHFRLPKMLVATLLTSTRRLMLVIVPLAGVSSVFSNHPTSLSQHVVGIFILLVGYLALSLILIATLRTDEMEVRIPKLRRLLLLGMSSVPLALSVLMIQGYYYTAVQLTDQLIETVYCAAAWLLLESVFVRGLHLAAGRLAFQRAMTKRQSATKEDAEGNEVVEEPTLGIEQINQQSLRLIHLTMLGLFSVALYFIWADMLTAINYLNNITLYEYTAGTGATATQMPITLFDLLGALVIFVITSALARNLPGLLEVLILSKLALPQGSSYAATTLLSYVIAGVGGVATLSVLGVSWDRLQWLVAALSVGLGFGLQEIFANFVSGLIILFERPVRIGDTVTLGDLSGTVSRIRIRATTIIDFDRKEIIVPNKVFVTDQLINWSLTDTVTRITIKVGVAYGSDLELVRTLLLRAASENPRILRDPAPVALFLNFGDSTLDHELRVHVKELADRLAAIDELNRAIDLLFKESNIEISFRQLDVHIRKA